METFALLTIEAKSHSFLNYFAGAYSLVKCFHFLISPLAAGNLNKKPDAFASGFLEAPPRFELGMKVLQTSALPLGYGAIYYF